MWAWMCLNVPISYLILISKRVFMALSCLTQLKRMKNFVWYDHDFISRGENWLTACQVTPRLRLSQAKYNLKVEISTYKLRILLRFDHNLAVTGVYRDGTFYFYWVCSFHYCYVHAHVQLIDGVCHICGAKNVLIRFVGPSRMEYNGCNFYQVLRVCFDADIKFQLFIVLSQTSGLMTDFIQLKFIQTQVMRSSG